LTKHANIHGTVEKLLKQCLYEKFVRKTLMKLTIGLVSSIFYEQLFHPYFGAKKFQSQTVTREKLRKTLLFKKSRVKC